MVKIKPDGSCGSVLKEWPSGRLVVFTPYIDSFLTGTRVQNTREFGMRVLVRRLSV